MDPIHSLLEWAASKGVSIRGIQPQTKTNCGIGMTATKNLKKGDVLVTVPTRAMRGLDTVPAAIRAKLPQEMSIHGLLAADFVLNPPAESWVKVIPTIDEFNSIPFFWPAEAQKLLPGTAKRLLKKQQSNFGRDWEHLQSAYPHVPSEDYMHAWFVVSSRAFYQETQQTLLYPWHDRLALLPVADLFNHASVGCKVSYCAESYEIVADREYGKGDEVCTCYGEHSNDFLLAEYGFLLQNNANDRFDPDDLISSGLSLEETVLLKQMKTLAALDQLCGPATSDEGRVENTPGAIDHVRLQKLLAKFLEEIKGCRQNVSALDDGKERYRTLLLQRWDQIDELPSLEGGAFKFTSALDNNLVDQIFAGTFSHELFRRLSETRRRSALFFDAGLYLERFNEKGSMAKLQPVLTIEEMEQQLGYKLDAKSESLETNSLLYSDLTLFVADLYQRTLREYEMFEKRPNRRYEAVPAAIPANCQEKVISSENDSITLRRSNLTGFYQYFADVQDNSGLAIRFLLTAEESLAVAAVTELERSGTEATISQVQKHDSALLSLPVEIRQHIYKHVLGNRCWYIAEPKTWRRHTFCRALGDPSGFYFPFGEADTLLRVNKQVRREALPVAYQGTAMHAVDIDGATALLMAIGRIGRDNMTSFQLGWESYADTQLNWSKPEIPDNVHLILPRLHVPTCVYLLQQCPRLTNLSLTFNNFFMEDIPLPAFQSDPGIRLCCSIQNIKRLNITDSAGEALDDDAAAKWLKEEILGS